MGRVTAEDNMAERRSPRRVAGRRVREILQILDAFFPRSLAEEWDNIGLVVGDPGAEVARVGVALNPSLAAVRAVAQAGGGLLVTHHPLFIRPERNLDLSTPRGRLLAAAIAGGVAIVACHTNADWADGGVNDILAARLGLLDVAPWEPLHPIEFRKVVVFVPETHLAAVGEAIFAAGGGEIGRYAKCSYRARGEGTFLPLAGAKPYAGRVGELAVEAEARLEVRVPRDRVDAALRAMRQAHPYEEPAFDVYPTEKQSPQGGRGRLGRLARPTALAALARRAAKALGARGARFVGDGAARIARVAVCGGGGASFIARAAGASDLALITGDVKYHDALLAQDLGASVIDLGHYHTERPFAEALAQRLGAALAPLAVFACDPEGDPFHYLF
jgi:dinuclear metal center YbgI/SA1388 family protein